MFGGGAYRLPPLLGWVLSFPGDMGRLCSRRWRSPGGPPGPLLGGAEELGLEQSRRQSAQADLHHRSSRPLPALHAGGGRRWGTLDRLGSTRSRGRVPCSP